MRIERCLIDANWGLSTDVVYQFCRQSRHSAIVMPSHGRFVGRLMPKPVPDAPITLQADVGPLEIVAQGDTEERKLRRFSMEAYTGGAMELFGWQ